MVVGTEPASRQGIASVDPATLTQIIEPYLGGSGGPVWTPIYVPIVESTTVLVVMVEAPKQGDPIFTLRKEFGNARSGAVFVRKHGITAPADASDMDALQARLVAAPPPTDIKVGLMGDVPISWFDGVTASASLKEWVTEMAGTMVAAAREKERQRLAPKPAAVFGTVGPLVAMAGEIEDRRSSTMHAMGLLGEKDKRSLDEYIAEVDAWAEAATNVAPDVALGRYINEGHGVVALTVANPTGRFLADVEVEVEFEGEHIGGFEEAPTLVELPATPRTYGERTPGRSFMAPSLGLDALFATPPLTPSFARPLRRTWVEVDQGSVRIRFHLGDLRQHGADTSANAFVLVKARPEDGILHGIWRATIRDQEGVSQGFLDVSLCDEPVDLATLFHIPAP